MNRLHHASSAYLRQHADNPVDWWPWGNDALARAAELDRPIFLSIGYAACHWCHVMAHESFEDRGVAAILNDNFVSIKVDREERPDIDTIYMAATQLVTGQGGWPMSVFLLPDGRPFLAGTYYPPVDRGGQIGMTRLLSAVRDAWHTQRDLVTGQADQLQAAIRREVTYVDHLAPRDDAPDLDRWRRRLRDDLLARCDEGGGFGSAPKFPRPSYVDALCTQRDDASQSAVARTLDVMSRGGLYDHIEGAFARYCVDANWRVPHFEKMLSDQALLARTYLRAHRRAARATPWRTVALQTLDFVRREFAVANGFASSLDADAGGVEGSHVTWTPAEVSAALGDNDCLELLDATLHRWCIEAPGNLDGRSVPRLAPDESFTVPDWLAPALRALRSIRSARPQPGRDDKVVLEWNAMLASALLATYDDAYADEGLALLSSLRLTHFDGVAWYRIDQRGAHATAADVAWLVDAELDAYEWTGAEQWLDLARVDAAYLVDHHWDGPRPSAANPNVGAGLFSSSDLVTDVPLRPKEIFDGATPSSHAVGARALARLGLIDGSDALLVAQRLVTLAAEVLATQPIAVVDLLDAAGFAFDGTEVVIPGPPNHLTEHVRLLSMSNVVLVSGSGSSPLLAARTEGMAYVCRAGVCQRPVSSIDELDRELHSVR